MSELKRISPMLDDFDVGCSISEHNGVFCYPAMRKDSDERYIVKALSIPASQTQLDALLLTGAFPDTPAALTYFQELADQTVKELEILQQLAALEGFLPYESWQVAVKGDDIGFDVCMLSPYRKTLRKHLQKQPMTHLAAINLGLDICTALAVCRRSGYLYADLKPNNIYVLDDQQYRIGDLGFIPLNSLSYASLPDRYRSEYTAPEIRDAFSTLNSTIDVYALGLILYQIYNGGELPVQSDNEPAEQLAAPVNADYEMSDIILKACDPNPDARWQDPVQMGQALVAYMQRNGANDTPIVPVIVPEATAIMDNDLSDIPLDALSDEDLCEADEIMENPAEDLAVSDATEEISNEDTDAMPEELPKDNTADDAPAEETIEEASITYEEDGFGNLSFLEVLPDDETAPENNVDDVSYEEISDELSQMLAQADALVAHQIPDPVVAPAPSPIVVPMIEANPGEFSDNQTDVDSPVEAVDAESLEEAEQILAEAVSNNPQKAEPVDDVIDTVPNVPSENKKRTYRWVLYCVIILLALAILATGFFYYRNIYLLPIDAIQVSGDESSMVVHVDSDIDESLLRVVCSDSHGNQIPAPVVNGTATFANLSPDTAYTVQVLVDGFHRLTGETAASYSTPAQTKIVQFSAVTGTEDGSAIIGFTIEGPDSGNWILSYSAPGEEEQTVELLSHMATLSGLTIGKEYTFALIPGDDMYVTGQTEIHFTASKLIYAQDVAIVSCVDNQLTVSWNSPDETSITEWTVRCYDDANYNETIITAETSAVFTNIDPAKRYTVEVTAAGMSISQRAYMAENPITISDFTADTSNANNMVLTWSSSQPVPEDGWVLLYTVDDSDIQSSVTCTENRAVISPVVPDANYTFKIQLANGDSVLTMPLQCKSGKAQDFSGYGMIRASMTYKLCKRPNSTDWDHSDLSDSDYTNTFKVGEQISFVGQLHDKYGTSDDKILTLYVFRDAEGNVVCYSYTEAAWRDMWNMYYGEFDVPQVPATAGDYTLSIYFNGKLVTNKDVVIEE